MGLIKWFRRRLEKASYDQKPPLNNETDETGYVWPIETRFPPQQPDEIRLPFRSVKGATFNRMRKLFRGYCAKSLSHVNRVRSDNACQVSSKKSSPDLESASGRTIVDNVYDEISAVRYPNI